MRLQHVHIDFGVLVCVPFLCHENGSEPIKNFGRIEVFLWYFLSSMFVLLKHDSVPPMALIVLGAERSME